MAAKLDVVSLAAHRIAVNVISTTFMVPLGISSAAAVRVGQAVGRRDPRGCGGRRLGGARAQRRFMARPACCCFWRRAW